MDEAIIGYGRLYLYLNILWMEYGRVEVEGERKRGRLRRTWERKVEEGRVTVGVGREDVLCRLKWSVGVNQIAAG